MFEAKRHGAGSVALASATLAAVHLRSTIKICQQIGSHELEGRAHKRLGLIAQDRGDLSAAHDHLETAFAVLTAAGEHRRAERALVRLRNVRRELQAARLTEDRA